MYGMRYLAAGLTAAFVMSGSVAAAATCRDSCDDGHLTCQRAGRAEAQCLDTWHQCRLRCDAPTVQKTSVTQTPVAATPPAKPKAKTTKPH